MTDSKKSSILHQIGLEDNPNSELRLPSNIELLRYMAQNGFLEFCMAIRKDYLPTKIHKYLCNQLQEFYEAVRDSKDQNLIIEVQPQLGKSTTASELFLAWVLGKSYLDGFASFPVICASYGSSLAEQKSSNCRDIVNSDIYQMIFPETKLHPETAAKEFWKTTTGGSYRAVGVGGGLTGMPGKILVADDLFKDRAEADSEATRESTWRWWDSVFMSRKQDVSGTCLINCLVGSTKILTSRGTWRAINRCRVGESILSFDPETKNYSKQKIELKIRQPKTEIWRLTTPNHILEGTSEHPVLRSKNNATRVYNKYDDIGNLEWVKIKDLKIGDYIVDFRRLRHSYKIKSVTLLQLWLLGFMFGDGWITKHPNKKGSMRYVTCVAKSVYPELNQRIVKSFYKIFNTKLKNTDFGYYRLEIADVGRWFLNHGLIGKAKTKRIPFWIFQLSEQERQVFLDGFVAADGYICKAKLTVIGLVNKKLVEDLKLLAMGLGYKTSNIFHSNKLIQPPNSPKPFFANQYRFSFGFTKTHRTVGLVKVEKIENTHKKEFVFDIGVSGPHSFIANGLVVHNTRWHRDDVAGRLEAQYEKDKVSEKKEWEYDHWRTLSFPAFALEDEYINGKLFRKQGEVLCPERFSYETMVRRRNSTDVYEWSSLYMQQPIMKENAKFRSEWFRYYEFNEIKLKELNYYTLVDPASSKSKRADNTVVRTIAKERATGFWFLMEETAGRMDPGETVNAIFKHVHDYPGTKVWVEAVAYQSTLQYWVEEKQRKDLIFFEINLLSQSQTRSKEARIEGLIPLYKNGIIFHRAGGSEKDYEAELLSFPQGKKDDRIDAVSFALDVVPNTAISETPEQKKKREREAQENFDPFAAFNKM